MYVVAEIIHEVYLSFIEHRSHLCFLIHSMLNPTIVRTLVFLLFIYILVPYQLMIPFQLICYYW